VLQLVWVGARLAGLPVLGGPAGGGWFGQGGGTERGDAAGRCYVRMFVR
jgi:hypothetical protein